MKPLLTLASVLLALQIPLVSISAQSEQKAELIVQTGHPTFQVNSITFSPNGKILASSSGDSTKLWDLETGQELRTFQWKDNPTTSLAFSPDGTILAGGTANGINLWDVKTGKLMRTLAGHTSLPGALFVSVVSFSPDGKVLGSSSNFDDVIKLWDVTTGQLLRVLAGHTKGVGSIAFSSDGKTLASDSSQEKTIKLWNWQTGQQLRTLQAETAFHLNSPAVVFSPNGEILASHNGIMGTSISLWDVSTGQHVRTVQGSLPAPFAYSFVMSPFAFSSDGKTVASGSFPDQKVNVWDWQTGQKLRTLQGQDDKVIAGPLSPVAFSTDGKTLAIGKVDNTIGLWNWQTGQQIKTLRGHTATVSSFTLSPNGKIIAASWGKSIKLWDVITGRQFQSLVGHTDIIKSVAFSPDGKIIASRSEDQTVKIWDVVTGRLSRSLPVQDPNTQQLVQNVVPDFYRSEYKTSTADGKFKIGAVENGKLNFYEAKNERLLASLISLDENDWVVVTPDGRFDTNKLENPQGLHWLVADAPFTPLSFEVFMRDYYEPRLLPRLMKCSEEGNCDKTFKPVSDLSALNRTQPHVKITGIKPIANTDTVSVTIEVANVTSEYQRDKQDKLLQSGVYDLRLFRDGQLVAYAPDASGKASAEEFGNLSREEELSRWRQTNKVEVGPGGKATITFPGIKLPRLEGVKQVEFSAYAFNVDRVKSNTDRKRFDIPSSLTPVKGRAYIVTVGVNAYENSDFNLEFAAEDARRMQRVVTERLAATGQYEKVVAVSLISDYEVRGRDKVATLKQATKENFRAVLELLSGDHKSSSAKMLKEIPNTRDLRPATPNDLVLIMYSSHGYADRSGNFYFIPYDTGPGAGKVFTNAIRQHSISSGELSSWLRKVDAGEMVMIVDACHSAAAIEGSEFKPGPMGSRGLGQLSYDKGMRILTATQADNVALENDLIKQGLLTYALVRDGIESLWADYRPKDKVIHIGEWLSYGVERVPKLYEEVLTGNLQPSDPSPARQTKVIIAPGSGESKGGSKELEEIISKDKAQQPQLFDFTTGRREVVLVK